MTKLNEEFKGVVKEINDWLADLNHSNNRCTPDAECPMTWSYVKVIGVVPKEEIPDTPPKGTTHWMFVGIEHWSQESEGRSTVGNVFPVKLVDNLQGLTEYELTESIDEVLGGGPIYPDSPAIEILQWIRTYYRTADPVLLDSPTTEEILEIINNPPMEIRCIQILGYNKGEGIQSMIKRLVVNHPEWTEDTFEYNYNSEGFELTLITNKAVNESQAENLISLISDQELTTCLGDTKREPCELSGDEFDLKGWKIHFYGWLPGSNSEGTDYYEELEKTEFFEDWNSIIDTRVLDYIRALNTLTKDTGIKIMSFDWSAAVLETPEGKLYSVDARKSKDTICYSTRDLNLKTK